MRLLNRIFNDHPASVGETYFEHMGMAMGFALRMFAGALACLAHAFIPCLCERTGSRQIITLYDRMVANRRRNQPEIPFEAALSI